MAIIIENGTGVAGANSYIDAAYVTTYLTNRARETENGWDTATSDQKNAAVVAAADYIEARFSLLFKGSRRFKDISLARASLAFTGQPTNTQTVTIGAVVYQFVTALATAGDVLIGDTVAESVRNLIDAVNLNGTTSGTGYHASTVANADAGAEGFADDSLLAFALAAGTAGNAPATTTTVSAASWNFATLVGGSASPYPQPLSFPRLNLFNADGTTVLLVPDPLKFAAAEYAVRAHSSALAPDPTVDAFGGTVTSLREKVGPIETETTYMGNTAGAGNLPAYPAADRLLREYLRNNGAGGGTIRG